MISTIGIILMVIGGLNFAWFLLWALMAWSGSMGAKMSKKVGTDNENTDKAIAIGENFAKDALRKVITSLVIFGIGALMHYVLA